MHFCSSFSHSGHPRVQESDPASACAFLALLRVQELTGKQPQPGTGHSAGSVTKLVPLKLVLLLCVCEELVDYPKRVQRTFSKLHISRVAQRPSTDTAALHKDFLQAWVQHWLATQHQSRCFFPLKSW